ncbi:MAG: hypothetical protein JO340_09745 [Acidobacteriaceae bacterium]|nr:hypothetical protein [Acidobacteriaceae bacterium]
MKFALGIAALFAAVALSGNDSLLAQISASGRCATLAESPDARVSTEPLIAPGPPPLISFRYYEGKLHHRFGNAELMLDDAGH